MSECFDDWPESPETGDEHILGDTLYEWDGEKWNGSSIDWGYSRDTMWSSVPLEDNPGNPNDYPDNWSYTGDTTSNWRAERERKDGTWGPWVVTAIRGESGTDGIDGTDGTASNLPYKSTCFIRSNTITEAPTGGDWSSPIPTSDAYSDGVPDGEETLLAVTRIFTIDGLAPQQPAWSAPVAMTDTTTVDYEWSDLEVGAGTPTTNQENWYNIATTSSVLQAIRIKTNGVYGEWQITKIKGEDGQDGEGIRYGGWYTISSPTGTWDDALAATAVPLGIPVEDDVVTIWKDTDVTVAVTKRFDGTSWITPEMALHGDLLAEGTVRGDRFVAGTEMISPLITTGTLNGGLINSPRIQMVGTSYMIVTDSTPFGPDNLLRWEGSSIVDGDGNPVISSLRKTNALAYFSAAGELYTSGTIRASNGIFSGSLQGATGEFTGDVTGSSFNGIRLKIGSFKSETDGDEVISVTTTEGRIYNVSTGEYTEEDTTDPFTRLLGVSLSHMGPSTVTKDMNFPILSGTNSFTFNRDDGYDGTQYFSYIAWGI